jgi:hypothetical protein
MHPVSIENEALRMEVWPSFGGKMSSLVDKADEFELLFNYPVDFPTNPQYDTSYAKGWYAGWDECFPGISPGPYAGHPYDGIPVPDHGELWGLPTTAVPSKAGITTVWHGLRFGYRLTRKLWLDGPSVRADYTLINLAPFDFRFVWAPNALLAMEQAASDVEITLNGPTGFRCSHDAESADIQQPFDWPVVSLSAVPDAPVSADLSRPASLPPRHAWKAFSVESISLPALVNYPSRGRSLKLSYESSEVTAYWGVWINTGGWAGHKHFSLQPTTGRFDQLDRSTRDGSAGMVGPSARCDWSFQMTVG